jgi:predicted transglutaminase-like cysteine proteinase
MAIPEKSESETSTVLVKLYGDAKKKVLEKKKQIRDAGFSCSNELAIIKLILDK